ncbi:MAG: 2-aminoethylphosphonate--pyruvate transaminase [Candidatus Binatia bacterium]|nr:MAG: 2-aminoethylphosphonate--pyruvate transaminase [Candidatus Binatia bacterium]
MRLVLLNPGPVNVSDRVRAALLGPDACHREPEFLALVRRVRERLARLFGGEGEYEAVLLTGSGTLAVEAMLSSGVGNGKLLVAHNGVYGQRLLEIARTHGIPTAEVVGSATEPLEPDRVRRALGEERGIEALAVVHHETSTGVLNPIAELGRIARQYGVRFLVDSVSGLGGDELSWDDAGPDLCAGTANKCLQGIPGISFVLVRRRVSDELASYPRRSLSLHLPAHLSAQRADSLLFTMAVQSLYAFDAALAELEEETVAGRIERYREAAALLRRGFEDLGLSFLVAPPHRSNSLTALWLPAGKTYEELHDRLKDEGFVVYAGQGDFARRIFRVANMGALERRDFERFLVALRKVLGRP